jgi:hypothetical protein
LYTIWRSCERFNILPPSVKPEFENNEPWTIALIIAYEQIRQMEDNPEVKEPKGKFRKGRK